MWVLRAEELNAVPTVMAALATPAQVAEPRICSVSRLATTKAMDMAARPNTALADRTTRVRRWRAARSAGSSGIEGALITARA
jgi:hypothetical protein